MKDEGCQEHGHVQVVRATLTLLQDRHQELLADHIRTCVAENIRAGNDEVIDELVRTMQKLMK